MRFVCTVRYYSVLLSTACFIILASCKYKQQERHPQYYAAFLSRIDTTFAPEARVPVIDSLEMALHVYPAGTGDWVDYYRRSMAYHLDKRNYEKVFTYLDSVDQLIDKRLDEEPYLILYCSGLTIRSNCYMRMKNYDAALNYLLLAKNKWGTRGAGEVIFYRERMAELFFRSGRFLMAAGYYKQALKDADYMKDPSFEKLTSIQGNLSNLALCYSGAEMYDSAAYYCKRSLDYLSDNELLYPDRNHIIQLQKAVVKATLAKVKHKENQYAEAEQMNMESIAVTEAVYEDLTRTSRLELAELYLDWNKLTKAEMMLKKLDSLHDFEERGYMEEDRKAWNNAMQKLSAKKGDTAKAFAYNTQYLALRDSLDLLEKNNTSRDLGRELENKEQRAAYLLLAKQNEKKTFQLVIASLLSAMAIGIILLTWFNFRKKAKYANLLENLNKEILIKNDDLGKAFVSLEESQADNTKISRMVAHDLKNPIGGIRNLVHSMLRKEQPQEFRAALEVIQTSCNNSLILINDLIKEPTIHDGGKESVDMLRIVQYCVNMLQTKADEKSQRLYLQADQVLITINREKMWRVISNLLNNAIKFSPEHTVINVKLQKKGEKLLFSVRDHGIGIPNELKDKIFTLQPEASRMGTAGEESHGLGLFISQKIVSDHHGRIWFQRNEGQEGCTFYVELPGAH